MELSIEPMTAIRSPLEAATALEYEVVQNGSRQGSQSFEASLPGFIKLFPCILVGDKLNYLKGKHAFIIPPRKLRSELLRNYLEFVHPDMPIINTHEFLEALHRKRSQSISLLLFQAIMFAGSAFVDGEQLRNAGYLSRREARKSFYERAKVR